VSAGVVAQCPACRALVVVGAVVVDGSRAADGTPRAGLPCAACGVVSWLPLTTTIVTSPLPSLTALPPAASPALADVTASAAATSSPAAPASTVAPPTPTPATTAAAATATAIATATFDDDTLARVRARCPAPEASQTHLAERFETLLTTTWAQEAEHKALLKAAAAAGELAFLGARYRAVLDTVRDEPRARAAQQELLTMAMATMSSQRLVPVEQGTSPAKIVVGILVFLAVGGGLFWMVRAMMAMLTRGGAGGLD
jgi:hypothetical protein